jgi:hypothetical protein
MPVDPWDAVEPALEDAQRKGVFENLPGKGKPLKLDTSPDAVFNNLLKDAGYKPEWIELSNQVAALEAQARQLLESCAAGCDALGFEASAAAVAATAAAAEEPGSWLRRLLVRRPPSPVERLAERAAELDRGWDTAVRKYAALLHEANRKLRRYNETVPLAGRQKALIPVAERLETFRQCCPRVWIDPDGGFRLRRGEIPPELLADSAREQGVKLPRTQEQLRSAQRLQRLARKTPPIG